MADSPFPAVFLHREDGTNIIVPETAISNLKVGTLSFDEEMFEVRVAGVIASHGDTVPLGAGLEAKPTQTYRDLVWAEVLKPVNHALNKLVDAAQEGGDIKAARALVIRIFEIQDRQWRTLVDSRGQAGRRRVPLDAASRTQLPSV